MTNDVVDGIIDQWSEERPELETACLGVVVRVMHLSKVFQREGSAALMPFGLELFEYDVLSALRRQGEPFTLAATQLAVQAELSTGAMTNRVDKLEQRGLVERTADPTDRRAVLVSLTIDGQKVIDEAIRVRLEAANATLRDLSQREIEHLASLLRRLAS